jgi:RHS repeat-associated protein
MKMVGVCSPFSIKTTLGSITQITNNSGNLAAEYSYDAWGRMRNPANWNVYSTTAQPTLLFGRGYTGHEHLNQFGLINMNARLYDPLLARFLAPDPFVGSGMTNDFNRYVYCRDNPMMYTDPDGKWSFEIGWGTGSKPGAFYRGSYGNSSLYGNYNTNTSTFTMGSTYYGYQTSNVIYQGQNQYTPCPHGYVLD